MMVLVRAWVKAELEGILQYGSKLPPVVSSRRFRSARRQHVQCIEVDEECSALKINDGETMVWCFVTKQGMHKFTSDGNNSSFSSLNSKTITIDDWEFSSMSALCPTFDERKAKTNGHICILINKFGLFGGERTTTIGKPSDLGEGNRDLRAIWRALSTPKDLVEALARGQGLTDLRDMNGVVMSAPGAELQGISWEDVEPALMAVSETSSPPQSPPPANGTAAQQNQQQSRAAAAAIPATEEERSPPANAPSRQQNSREKSRGGGGEGGGRGGGGGRDFVDDLSQQSLGMEYDGDLGGGGGDDFHTQAQSAGNVFSQEEMDMRPASPTPPSPPPPAATAVGHASGGGGGGNGGAGPDEPQATAALRQEADVQQQPADISPGPAPHLGGYAYDDAPLGGGDPEAGRRQAGSANGGGGPAGAAGEVVERPSAGGFEGHRGGGGSGGNDDGNREEEKEDESGSDPIPPGFTQLDIVPGGRWPEISSGLQPRGVAIGETKEEEEEEEDERIGRLRPGDERSAGSAAGGPRTSVALDKGKGRGKGKGRLKLATGGGGGGQGSASSAWQQPRPPGNGAAAAAAAPAAQAEAEVEAEAPTASADGIRAATAGASGGGGGGGGGGGASATQDSLSPEDSLSPQELSGATSSSSNIGSPNIKNGLGLSCLTQKRQNEERCHPNSGARTAAEKCDIRSVFRTGARGGGRSAGALAARSARSDRDPDGGEGSEDDTIRHARSRHFPPPLAARNHGGGGGGGGGGSGGGVDRSSAGGAAAGVHGSGEEGPILSTPDTVDMEVEDGVKPLLTAAQKAARKFPGRPLQGGVLRGARKRKRPLSDIVVAVDPEWDGVGRPPVVARGADADEMLAEWLDASRPVKRPVLSIAAWLDKYAGGGGGGDGGVGGGGGGASSGGRSSSGSGDGGWRC